MDTTLIHTTDSASALLQTALHGKPALAIAEDSLKVARMVATKHGIPEVRNERYKYANVKKVLNEGGYQPQTNPSVFSDALLENISTIKSANTLVTLNGKLAHVITDGSFNVLSISDYLAAHPEVSFDESDAMQALCLLTAEEGFYLKVNKSSDEPLVWYNIFSADVPTYFSSLNVITAAAEISADIVEVRIGKNNQVFANQLLEVFTRHHSNLRISVSDDSMKNTSGIFSVVAHQEKESTFSHSILSTGGKFFRQNITAEHVGENCHTELNGFYAANAERHQDFCTTVKHNLPNCTSDELYKGVATDRSKAIFNGKVYVARDAQKTNAYQSNKNILLSDEALIRSKPELEIYADDVKCSHGSTTGQTDTKSLFYLRSRGIREKEAQKMLMLAFAGDVLERISNEEIRNYLADIAEKKLQEIL